MRLSILTPSYNYGRFLDDSAQSIIAQDSPVQWVIQDAESEDSTTKVVASANPGAVVVDYRSEPDAGQSDALNRALLRANGDWIGWLNADEFYLQNAFYELALAVSKYPDADVIFGDCVLVDEDGRYLRRLSSHTTSRAALRWSGIHVTSCSVFFRAKTLRKMGWDTTLRRAMDWDLWLRLEADGATFQHIPITLSAFRVHDAQVTNAPESEGAEEFARLRQKHGLPSAGIPAWQRVIGRGVHIGLKVAGGAYLKEFRDRHSLRNRDMRWWRSGEATSPTADLSRRP